MNIKQKIQASLTIVYLFATMSLYAQRTVKIAYHEVYPDIYTEGGTAKGRMVTNITNAMEKAGYKVEFKSMPLKRIYYSLIRGKVDAWYGTTTVPHLQGETLNSVPLAKLELRAYFVGDKAKLTNNEGDYNGKKIITLFGESYGTLGAYLRDESNNVDIMEVKKYEQGVKALIAGRKDYLMAYKENIQNNPDASSLNFSKVDDIDYALIISKEIKDGKEIVDKFNKAWNELKSSGGIK